MGERFEPKKGWNSVDDNIVNDFYRKALARCARYDRLTGFFNSNAFAVAIREVLDFVERGGRMRLITSAEFSQADLGVITKNVEAGLAEKVEEALEDDIGRKCLAVFGHMLSTHVDGGAQLEIKILVPQRGIFHPKVGVFTMQNGDVVSFSGSVNETGMGWAGNIEEFKAFCSWKDGGFVDIDESTFKKFWNGAHPDIRTYDLPMAVREKILSVRPGSDDEYKKLLRELRKKMDDSDGVGGTEPEKFELRGYQKDAINAWVSKGHKGILEMPTATGKTFTAMGCINRLQKKRGRLFTVIAVPYTHLTQQWKDKVMEWNGKVDPEDIVSSNVINTTELDWKRGLRSAVVNFNKKYFSGGYVVSDYIVCTTYNVLAKPEFIEAIKDVKGETLLVADEAHHTGAPTTRKGLLEEYSARLALTATPTRYFDEEGSKLIQEYFDGVAYSMEIGTAIQDDYLAPYEYHPEFAELTATETDEYVRLTKAIAIDEEKNKNKPPSNESLLLKNKRARIVAKAEQKYQKLTEILESHGNRLEHALIYCHDGKQLKNVGRILSERNIAYEKISAEDSMIETRDKLEDLAWNNHQCIVAMKCLDEGVDIPSAQLGIIMASTGNSLQYIQRRGRFLRKSDGKDHAVIYDILVSPPESVSMYVFARKLVAKELLRHKEFAADARNRDEALDKIRPTADRFGIDLDKLDLQYMLSL